MNRLNVESEPVQPVHVNIDMDAYRSIHPMKSSLNEFAVQMFGSYKQLTNKYIEADQVNRH